MRQYARDILNWRGRPDSEVRLDQFLMHLVTTDVIKCICVLVIQSNLALVRVNFLSTNFLLLSFHVLHLRKRRLLSFLVEFIPA
jgi:hypothetical protein